MDSAVSARLSGWRQAGANKRRAAPTDMRGDQSERIAEFCRAHQVVATSTLELGVDNGDLDCVIQLDAPHTVASCLQRLGRTGRRAGSRRNMVFLATTDAGLLQSAALLRLWGQGFVQPVRPPAAPAHIAAQQLLALGLQEGRFPLETRRQWWPGLDWIAEARPVLQHLLDRGYLGFDSGFAMVGPKAERAFGRRNFTEVTSVFTAAPEFTVLRGREALGTISPLELSSRVPPGMARLLSLARRSWRVTHVDWRRRQVFEAPADGGGKSVWGSGSAQIGYELAQSIGVVLRGEDTPEVMSKRAVARMSILRGLRRAASARRRAALCSNGHRSRRSGGRSREAARTPRWPPRWRRRGWRPAHGH